MKKRFGFVRCERAIKIDSQRCHPLIWCDFLVWLGLQGI
jgi:hypothetical protein